MEKLFVLVMLSFFFVVRLTLILIKNTPFLFSPYSCSLIGYDKTIMSLSCGHGFPIFISLLRFFDCISYSRPTVDKSYNTNA